MSICHRPLNSAGWKGPVATGHSVLQCREVQLSQPTLFYAVLAGPVITGHSVLHSMFVCWYPMILSFSCNAALGFTTIEEEIYRKWVKWKPERKTLQRFQSDVHSEVIYNLMFKTLWTASVHSILIRPSLIRVKLKLRLSFTNSWHVYDIQHFTTVYTYMYRIRLSG